MERRGAIDSYQRCGQLRCLQPWQVRYLFRHRGSPRCNRHDGLRDGDGLAGTGTSTPHIYRSTNGGASWINISSNLPNAPANAVMVDPNDANTVYVAMDS